MRRALALAATLLSFMAWPGSVVAQVEERLSLDGAVLHGDTAMSSATVVLHHLAEGEQGELDSLRVGADGRFTFPLPRVPDPARGDMFFASVRHHGVLYFGPAITTVAQLDSVYAIRAYDTLLAPSEGLPLALESRSVFFEPDTVGWRVTDLFQLRNDRNRTIVARRGGRVWSHPLPAEARDVRAGEDELAFDAIRFEDGRVVARAALPPGERLFVVRYHVERPDIAIPVAAGTEAMDVLVREPAPPLAVAGLESVAGIELEPGSTFRRFTGTNPAGPAVVLTEVEEVEPPRVEWAAVILALLLTAAGLFVLRPGPGGPRRARPPTYSRDALLKQVALLDEEHEGRALSNDERVDFERRRADLIRRIRSLG